MNILNLALPVWQTIAMAAAGTLVAIVVGTPLAVYIAARGPGARVLLNALSAVRAIPDLTLAILAVVVVGIGPAAGVAALAIFYTAMIARMYAQLLGTAPPAPLNALAATGASRLQVALYGTLPATLNDLITFGGYSFDCALRSSIIVGAVGAGGLGAEIVGSIDALDYRRVALLVAILVALVWIVDWFAAHVRRKPLMALVLVPFGIAGIATSRPVVFAVGHALHTFAGMWPPLLDHRELVQLPVAIFETLEIAVGGTALAVALAIPLGLIGARRFAPPALTHLVRRCFDVLRSVPEVVIGLILVVAVGVGPLAGALALGIHSTGVLGKLFSESVENVPAPALEALAATGAGRVAIATYGGLPLALGPMFEHTLFRLEWNLRTATVVGMIGAGGIGQALFNSQQTFHYHEMLAYVMITWAFVLGAEALGKRLNIPADLSAA
jgi:phosphonate transport system permease protein